MEVSSNSGASLGTPTDWLPLVKHDESPPVTGFGTTVVSIVLLLNCVSLSLDIQRRSAKGSGQNWSLNQCVCESKVVLIIAIS
jgi:hypothetical protein